jgi:hypothetical protein
MEYQLVVALAAVRRRVAELDAEARIEPTPAVGMPGLYTVAYAAQRFDTTYDGLRKKLDRYPYREMVVEDGSRSKMLSGPLVEAFIATGRLPERPARRLVRGRR